MKLTFPHLASCLALWPLAAHGTIVTTSTDEDDGTLGGGTGISLREAVNYSTAGDTITFTPALSGKTIRLTLGELLISQSLTIDGSALALRIKLSGDKTGDGRTADDTRVMRINAGTVVLDSLTICEGNCPASPATQGAGIYVSNNLTKLTVRNSILTANDAIDGGGIYFSGLLNTPDSFLRIEDSVFMHNTVSAEGGAIRIFGRLLIYDSLFSANSASSGGAIYLRDGTSNVERTSFTENAATVEGGAIWNYRTFDLTDSYVHGNSAPRGGGINGFSGTLRIENSIISANSASAFGGGVRASGTLNLINSTLAENSAITDGGGIYCNILTASLKNSTVSANSAASTSGGIYNNGRSTIALNNAIVAGNSAPISPDLSGSFTGANNITTGNPQLAPLGMYGGATMTMPPLPGSPAIDAGGATTLMTDQRGFPRVSTPDIGAVEYQGNADLARVWTVDPDGDGSPYGAEQALGTDNFSADPANSGNLTSPVFDASGELSLSFGINSAAVAGTRWILKRSPDLSPGSFVEVYRYDGVADTAAAGFGYIRNAAGVLVTDENPPADGAFYRFEAGYDP